MDFTFVESGGSLPARFNGLSEAALQTLLRDSGLKAVMFERREDTPYGSPRASIPTFFVQARKRP